MALMRVTARRRVAERELHCRGVVIVVAVAATVVIVCVNGFNDTRHCRLRHTTVTGGCVYMVPTTSQHRMNGEREQRHSSGEVGKHVKTALGVASQQTKQELTRSE